MNTRIVYIAENKELSNKYPGQIVFKIGYTDRHISQRILELNGNSKHFTSRGIYGGVQLINNGKWYCRPRNTRPAVKKFEDLLKVDITNHGGVRLAGLQTLNIGRSVNCNELYKVKHPFTSRYLTTMPTGQLRFRWFFRICNFNT